ncbi:ribosomal oxygenase 2 isoform X2 [Lampetra planeri]
MSGSRDHVELLAKSNAGPLLWRRRRLPPPEAKFSARDARKLQVAKMPKRSTAKNARAFGKPKKNKDDNSCTAKKVKAVVESSDQQQEEADVTGILDFSSPDRLFSSLIAPVSTSDFFQQHWERGPLVLHRSDARYASCYSRLFRLQDLEDICTRRNVAYGEDINLCRYVKETRHSLNKSGRATYPKLQKDFEQNKFTFQFHQPQRFKDDLWQIQEKLESFFGALVGSNVYVTPPGSQGLAPHHDDVEVFILQLEGEKHWRLYTPLVPLAKAYSPDLSQVAIGPPTHEFTLQAGDLLYFPRGTIHQADTPAGGCHSTHLTISTYQNNTWGDLLLDTLPALVTEASRAEISFRRGLPRRLLTGIGSEESGSGERIAELLGVLSRRMLGSRSLQAHSMKRDFVANRLPPFHPPDCQPGSPVGPIPKLQHWVRMLHADHMALVVDKPPREEGEEVCEVVFVYHSLLNSRERHMMGSPTEEAEEVRGLRLALVHLPALRQLMTGATVRVRELPLASDAEREQLVLSLWSDGLLVASPNEA